MSTALMGNNAASSALAACWRAAPAPTLHAQIAREVARLATQKSAARRVPVDSRFDFEA
jgi:hypothetical protein